MDSNNNKSEVVLLRIKRKRYLNSATESIPPYGNTVLLKDTTSSKRVKCTLVESNVYNSEIKQQTANLAKQQLLKRKREENNFFEDEEQENDVQRKKQLDLASSAQIYDADLHLAPAVAAAAGAATAATVATTAMESNNNQFVRMPLIDFNHTMRPLFDLPMDRAIFIAFNYGTFDEVFRLVDEENKDVNTMRTQSDFTTALMAACKWGNYEVASALIMRGADTDLVDVNGNSAHTFAGECGDGRLVELLKQNECVYDLYLVNSQAVEEDGDNNGTAGLNGGQYVIPSGSMSYDLNTGYFVDNHFYFMHNNFHGLHDEVEAKSDNGDNEDDSDSNDEDYYAKKEVDEDNLLYWEIDGVVEDEEGAYLKKFAKKPFGSVKIGEDDYDEYDSFCNTFGACRVTANDDDIDDGEEEEQ